jgi:Na+/H+ antiporter NhaA
MILYAKYRVSSGLNEFSLPSTVVPICTIGQNTLNPCILPTECICVFHMVLTATVSFLKDCQLSAILLWICLIFCSPFTAKHRKSLSITSPIHRLEDILPQAVIPLFSFAVSSVKLHCFVMGCYIVAFWVVPGHQTYWRWPNLNCS